MPVDKGLQNGWGRGWDEKRQGLHLYPLLNLFPQAVRSCDMWADVLFFSSFSALGCLLLSFSHPLSVDRYFYSLAP